MEQRKRVAAEVIWLIVFISICFAAAALGSVATTAGLRDWYEQLSKPTWTPPNWVFGPVWTMLYLSMAVAAWIVWRQDGFRRAAIPLGLFTIQLSLNTLWSILFFGLRSPGLAAIEIVLLWVAIIATVISFWPRSRTAAWLMLPYLAWVTFAAALNIAIWRMNGGS